MRVRHILWLQGCTILLQSSSLRIPAAWLWFSVAAVVLLDSAALLLTNPTALLWLTGLALSKNAASCTSSSPFCKRRYDPTLMCLVSWPNLPVREDREVVLRVRDVGRDNRVSWSL